MMSFETAMTSLRVTDRKRLLRHLTKLGDPDPQQRAEAGLAATRLLQEKGISWPALVPIDTGKTGRVTPSKDWRELALDIATHPGITPTERSYVLKVAGWKSPGADGLERLRAIAERVEARTT